MDTQYNSRSDRKEKASKEFTVLQKFCGSHRTWLSMLKADFPHFPFAVIAIKKSRRQFPIQREVFFENSLSPRYHPAPQTVMALGGLHSLITKRVIQAGPSICQWSHDILGLWNFWCCPIDRSGDVLSLVLPPTHRSSFQAREIGATLSLPHPRPPL